MYFCAWRSCICKQWSKGTHLHSPSTLVMGRRGRTAAQPDHPACHCLWAALPERVWPPNPTSPACSWRSPRGSSGEPLPLLSTACRQCGWTQGMLQRGCRQVSDTPILLEHLPQAATALITLRTCCRASPNGTKEI